MKKLYRGCIWIIILLPIMASQNAFAETFLGNWNSSQGKTSVASAIQANSLQDIVDGQYAFELTDQANVIINLNSPEDPYLFLLSTDNNNQYSKLHIMIMVLGLVAIHK